VKSFNEMLDQINAAIDRERDANRLKDEFLATLSHELRTPLNAVLGWARILRTAESIEPATQQRALESIERNAQAQTRLIEDLLEISRIVTGKLRLHVAPMDLAAVLDAAAEIVRPAAAAKQIRLEVEVRVRPAMTLGDPDRLQQIIWNLLSNAVKFTPPGGRIALRLTRNHGYHLAISDSGVGIEPAFLPHAFEAFRQADGTARREHGGLGLGLAIAKQLVELHGGTIQVRSEGKGRGATFEIVLPSVLGEPASHPASAEAAVHAAGNGIDASLLHNRRVLVVDDDEDARAVIEMTLRQYGADVVATASAAEAIDALNRSVPDVLLSDIGMAHEDGLMLLRRVRSRTVAEGGQVPAVAVTAYASERDRDAAASAGYQAHVAKPFDPHELVRVVARLAGTTTARPM
jgi:CheY-like chemotaxis protein